MFKIGLFSINLDPFFEDCKKTEKCDLHNYDDFDGWAIGMFARVSSIAPGGGEKMTQGVCFTADWWCVFMRKIIYPIDTNLNKYENRYILSILKGE